MSFYQVRPVATALCGLGMLGAVVPAHGQPRQQPPQALVLTGEYRGTHDPSMAQQGSHYYVFATGAAVSAATPAGSSPSAPSGTESSAALPQLPVRCSTDLHAWRRCGAVFPDGIPAWIRQKSPTTKELWAPDVSYFDGLYHLYYAYSAFGKNTSGIALATNRTLDSTSPDYRWKDQGLVVESTTGDDFNAIDPNLILDGKGGAWLSFGSFWSGIKMRKLDRGTGKLSTTDTRTYALASRRKPASAPDAKPGMPPDWEAIEAPFIQKHGTFFYLFTSWDLCCRGAASTYHIVVGRSASVTGPYVDKDGTLLTDGGGTALLTGDQDWAGPGGESLLQTAEEDLLVFHAYDAKSGKPALHISTIGWDGGWPATALAPVEKQADASPGTGGKP